MREKAIEKSLWDAQRGAELLNCMDVLREEAEGMRDAPRC